MHLSSHFSEDADNRNFCPGRACFAVIEKQAGCNHLHCSNCNADFCWICLFEVRLWASMKAEITHLGSHFD